jgi:hypothetical protein
MSPRQLASLVAAGRIGLGAVLVAEPERLVVPWIGRAGAHPGPQVLGRALGARDLVLGAGAISASDDALLTWLIAAIAADATDLLATLGAGRGVPLRGRVLVGIAAFGGLALGAGAVAGLLGARQPD